MTIPWTRLHIASPAAALAGVACALAFDPVGLRFSMLIGVAGLMLLARQLRAASASVVIVVALIFGASFMAPLIWWMNAVSHGAYLALVVAQTLFFLPVVFAMRAVSELRVWPVAMAAIWVGGETARSSFPFNGFPWGRLAHTAIDTPFAAFVRVLGMPGTSAVLAVVAAMLAVLVVNRTRAGRLLAAGLIAGFAIVGSVLPTGLAGDAGSRDVALIQGDVPGVFLSWPRGEILDLHVAETRRLIARIESGQTPRPDMVLWPENATDLDPYKDESVRRRIESLSRDLGAPILVGGIFDGPTDTTSYNAGVVWDENGPGDRYVKRKPVPFGEYVPFRSQLDALHLRFDRDIPRDMLAGDEPGTLRIANTLVGDTICYDIAYDSVVRNAIDAGAQVIVVQTSNAAFTGTAQPEQQWKISRLRAIETGRYVLVPSSNGISGIVGPDGRTLQRAAQHQPATLTATIQLASQRTLAMRLGAPIEWIVTGFGLAAWAAAIWRRRR